MSKPWTAELVKKELGVKKNNGDWDSAVQNLTLKQAINVAEAKKDDLSGADLRARTREVIGTCVAMRVRVEGKLPKDMLRAIDEGEYDSDFE